MFVKISSSATHKDSFVDLVRTGDPFWTSRLSPEKTQLGYLWVTPMPPDQTKSLSLNLECDSRSSSTNAVRFSERRIRCWTGRNWASGEQLISTPVQFGRLASDIDGTSPWKHFGPFQEMHITLTKKELEQRSQSFESSNANAVRRVRCPVDARVNRLPIDGLKGSASHGGPSFKRGKNTEVFSRA